jgi:hypothetical protein
MSAVVAARVWLRRLASAVPRAWRYDAVFRWSTIGAGIALALLVLRLVEPPARPLPPSAPGLSATASLAPTQDASAIGSKPALPKIAPGRSLDGLTIMPAPEHDRFGTAPPVTHTQ